MSFQYVERDDPALIRTPLPPGELAVLSDLTLAVTRLQTMNQAHTDLLAFVPALWGRLLQATYPNPTISFDPTKTEGHHVNPESLDFPTSSSDRQQHQRQGEQLHDPDPWAPPER